MNGAASAPAMAAAAALPNTPPEPQQRSQQSANESPVVPLLSSQHHKIHIKQATLPSPSASSFISTGDTSLSPGGLVNHTQNANDGHGHSHLRGSPSSPSHSPSHSQSHAQSSFDSHSRSNSHSNPSNVSHATVLSRLSALFHHEPASSSPLTAAHPPVAFPNTDGDDDLVFDLGDADSPRPSSPQPPPKEARPAPPDRNAIKVLVVTWNMGDALPKGDLSVLLGDVPAYEPTARDAVEGLPRLPVENVHPYHVVVFAAQECPTPSGVPRGLGGGLMKGVGLQKPEALFRKEKEGGGKDGTATPNVKEPVGKVKDKDGKETREGSKDEKPLGDDKDKPLAPSKDKPPAVPLIDTATNGTSTPRKVSSLGLERLGLDGLVTPSRNQSGPQSPMEDKASPFDDERQNHLHHLHLSDHRPALRPPAGLAPGPKGWSAMLEEWLCAGPRANITQPNTNATNTNATNTLDTNTGFAKDAPAPNHSPAASTSALPDSPPVITMSPIDLAPEDAPWGGRPSPFAQQQVTPPKVVGSAPTTPAKAGGTPSKPIVSHTTPSPATKPIGIPGSLSVPPLATSYGRSPMTTSVDHGAFHMPPPSAFGSSVATTNFGSTPGSSVLGTSHLAPPTFAADRPDRDMTRSPSQRSDRSERFDVPIPERPRREPGTGSYINVAKERLLGLYLSVFVYRGCEHLVEGVDKDYVTAGLAGGRFGNKGGIGISLNLSGHRMLFVNAHLAAHAERNDARIANVSKIKSELNLNCFLPADDPRAMLEDITDRFDTTFWCGDLNFRVDISLLHARWLLEQKKYQDALMFDQLKKAMEDPKTNPFPGFQEAPITFMPTFKYDVWKSVRATNRDIRRSLRRRRNTLERPAADAAPNLASLEFVPEGDGPEESGSDTREDKAKSSGCSGAEDERKDGNRSRSATSAQGDDACASDTDLPPPRRLDDPACSNRLSLQSQPDGYVIPDGASGRSSLYVDNMSQSFAHSFATTDTTPRLSGEYSLRRSSLIAHSPLATGSFGFNDSHPTSPVPKPKGLKEKTRKLLGILSLARRPSQPRPAPFPRHGLTPTDDVSSRRMSISSLRSVRSGAISEDGRSHVSNMSSEGLVSPCPDDMPEKDKDKDKDKERTNSAGASERNGYLPSESQGGNGNARPRASSTASQNLLSSPPRRHLSILRRTPSGRSGAPPVEEEYCFDLEDFDDTKDHRVGRYDTSKKQRIPSWCDRVLYKTHIIPDEDVIEDDDESSRFEHMSRFSRISHALSNLGDHFRRRSMAFEPASLEKEDHLTVPSTPPSRLEATGDSVAASIMRDADRSPERLRDSPAQGIKPLPDAGDEGSGLPRSLGSRSITFDGLPMTPRTGKYPDFMSASAGTSPEKDSRISPIAFKPHRTSSAADSTPSRRASGSQLRRASVSSRRGSVSNGSISLPRRRTTDSGIGQLEKLTHVKSTGHSFNLSSGRRLSGGDTTPLSHVRSDGDGFGGGTRSRRQSTEAASQPQSLNVIARFLRDLPGRFHSRVSLFHGSDVEHERKDGRHLAGEVEVLHYGTIDDAGMRQLEGRSDHRPAIFAAAVYV